MDIHLAAFRELAAKRSKTNKKYLDRLKFLDSRDVDKNIHNLHEEVFQEIDCLRCGNCCKTTSPIFYQTDIERAAKALRLRPGDFVEKFLKIDEEKDYVLKSSPCAFLGADNYCSIYESRPKACREYPHTNRKKMVQIMDLTYRNTLVCPAVLEILERLKKIMGNK